MQQKLITPAEYARRSALNRSTVSRQIAEGKIPTHNGLIDPAEADQARRENINHKKQIGGRANQRRSRLRVVPKVEEDEIDWGARAVFEALIAGSARVPEFLAELGVKDPVVLAIAGEVFVDICFRLASAQSDAAYAWGSGDDCSLPPTVDMGKLAKRFGFKFNPRDVALDFKRGRKRTAAEQLLEAADRVIAPWPPKAA